MRRRVALLLAASMPALAVVAAAPAHAAASTTAPVVKALVYRHGISSSDSDLWTMNADGTGKVALPKSTSKNATTINSGAHDGNPWFSADRRFLAFSSTRSGTQHVWVANLATGAARDVTPSTGTAAPVGCYVDETGAQRVVYVQGTSGSAYRLWSVRVDGTGTRPVTDQAYAIGRSDVTAGGKLAVAGDLDGSGHRSIFVAQLSAGSLTASDFSAVTSPAADTDDNSPAWSPSGALAFSRGPKGSTAADIYVLAAAATEATTPVTLAISNGQESGVAMYSGDGAHLDYSSTPDGDASHYQIWVVGTDPASGLPAPAGSQGLKVTAGTTGDYQGAWR